MNPLIQRLVESNDFHGVTLYEACGHTNTCRCGHTEKRTVPGKCPPCQWGMHESAGSDKNTPLPVIVDSRPVEFHRCPHCQQEIYEKHIYEQDGIDYHSDCKGAIKLPPTDWSKVSPEWRKLLGGPA